MRTPSPEDFRHALERLWLDDRAVTFDLDLAALAKLPTGSLPVLTITFDLQDELHLTGHSEEPSLRFGPLPLAIRPRPGYALPPRSTIRLWKVQNGRPIWAREDEHPTEQLVGLLLDGLRRAFMPSTHRSRSGWFKPYGQRDELVDCAFVQDACNGRDAELALQLRLQDRLDAFLNQHVVPEAEVRHIDLELDPVLAERCYPSPTPRPRRNLEAQLRHQALTWASQKFDWFFAAHGGDVAGRRCLTTAQAHTFVSSLPFVPSLGNLAACYARDHHTDGELLLDGTTPPDPLVERYGYQGGAATLPILVASLPGNTLQGLLLARSWYERLEVVFRRTLTLTLIELKVEAADGTVYEATAEELLDPARLQDLQEQLQGLPLAPRASLGCGPTSQQHGRDEGGWYRYRTDYTGASWLDDLELTVRTTALGSEVVGAFHLRERRPLHDGDKLLLASTKGTVKVVDDADLPGPKDDHGHCQYAFAVAPNKLFGKHVDLLEQVVHRAVLEADPTAELPDRDQPWDCFLPPEVQDLDGILTAAAEHYGLPHLGNPQVTVHHQGRTLRGLRVEVPVYPDIHTSQAGSDVGDRTLWTLVPNILASESPRLRERFLERLEANDVWQRATQLLATLTGEYTLTEVDGELWVDGPGLDQPVPCLRVEQPLTFLEANSRLLDPVAPHPTGCWDADGQFCIPAETTGWEGTLLHPDPNAWLAIVLQGGPRRLGRLGATDRRWPQAHLVGAQLTLGSEELHLGAAYPDQSPTNVLVLPPEVRRLLTTTFPVGQRDGRTIVRVDRALWTLNELVRTGTLPAGRVSVLFPDEVDGSRCYHQQRLAWRLIELLGARSKGLLKEPGLLTGLCLKALHELFNPRLPGLRTIADADPSVDPDTVEVDPAWLDHCLNQVADLRLAEGLSTEEAIERLREDLPGFLLSGDVVLYYRPPVEPGHGFVAGRVQRGQHYLTPFDPHEPRCRINRLVLEHLLRGDRDGDLLYLEPAGDDEVLFDQLRPSRLTEVYRDLAREYADERHSPTAAAFADSFDFPLAATRFTPTVLDLDGTGEGLSLRADPSSLAIPNDDLLNRQAEQAARAATLKSMAQLRLDEYHGLTNRVRTPEEHSDLAAWYRLVGEAGIDKRRTQFGPDGSLDEALTAAELNSFLQEPFPLPSERLAGVEHPADRLMLCEDAPALWPLERALRDLVDAPRALAALEAYRAVRGLARELEHRAADPLATRQWDDLTHSAPLHLLFRCHRPSSAVLEELLGGIAVVGTAEWLEILRAQLHQSAVS